MFRTPEFENYIAPAKVYPAFWRLLLGILTAVVIYVLFVFLIGGAVAFFYGGQEAMDIMARLQSPDDPRTMFILLMSFFGMAFAAVGAAIWHRRGFASLIGPMGPAFRDWLKAAGLSATLFVAIGFLSSFIMGFSVTQNMQFSTWLYYLPLALPLLLVQTGSEELLFRGYLMQQLAARFRSPIIWFMLPSLAFAAGHYNPEMPPVVTWLIVAATGLFGIIAADLTRITGNLGAAIGFHFVNNFFALFLVGVSGQMTGLSLYLAPFTMDDVSVVVPLLLLDMVTVVIVWGVLRRTLRR